MKEKINTERYIRPKSKDNMMFSLEKNIIMITSGVVSSRNYETKQGITADVHSITCNRHVFKFIICIENLSSKKTHLQKRKIENKD